jgi:hypothetical protein
MFVPSIAGLPITPYMEGLSIPDSASYNLSRQLTPTESCWKKKLEAEKKRGIGIRYIYVGEISLTNFRSSVH